VHHLGAHFSTCSFELADTRRVGVSVALSTSSSSIVLLAAHGPCTLLVDALAGLLTLTFVPIDLACTAIGDRHPADYSFSLFSTGSFPSPTVYSTCRFLWLSLLPTRIAVSTGHALWWLDDGGFSRRARGRACGVRSRSAVSADFLMRLLPGHALGAVFFLVGKWRRLGFLLFSLWGRSCTRSLH